MEGANLKDKFWDIISQGVVEFDADFKVTDINSAFSRNTDLRFSDFKDQNFEEFLQGFQGLDSQTIQQNLRSGHTLTEESVIDCGNLQGHYPLDFHPVIQGDTFQGFFITLHLDRPMTEETSALPDQELIEALNQTQESVLITDAELEAPGPKIVYVNSGFSEMTGYCKSEVIGKTPRILQGPDTERYVIERLKKSLIKGEKFEGETVNYRKDGTPFILQWETTALKDENNEIKHYLAVQRDVTKKRRLEKQYQESEVSLTQYLAKAPFGIAIHNLEGIIYANQEATYLVGYQNPQHLIGEDIFQFLRPDYRELAKKRAMALLEEDQEMEPIEEVLISKDGEEKTVKVTGIPCFYHGQKAIQIIVLDISKQKAAEHESQVQAEKFRALSEGSTIGIYLFQDGVIQYANPKLAEITGYPLNSLVGTDPLPEMVHPKDRAAMLNNFQNLNNNDKKRNDYEFRFYTQKGELRHAELHSTKVIYNSQSAILGSLLDISERKQAEQELRDNKHFIEKVNENSPALILILDLNQQKFIYENGCLAIFTGYTMEEINQRKGAFVEEMVHPDDTTTYDDFLAKDSALEDGETNKTQVRLKTKAGCYKWIQMIHTPFKRDEDGHVSQVISTKQDIDNWQHLMESYKRSEQFFRQLFENSAAGLILLDTEYNIQTCNPAFESIFKWNENEIQGANPKTFLVPEEKEAESDKISKETLEGRTNKRESIRKDKYGNKVPVLITGIPVIIDEVPVGIFHVYRDILEQKNNEEALQQQAEELLRMNEQLERFAYITSHNLRAPVANLTALLDLFDPKAIKDDSAETVFQQIESSIHQMDDTVNDLSDVVSRKNQSEQPKETVYFRDLLEKVKLSLTQSIEVSGAIIEADFSEEPAIHSVKITLQNILHELIDNALKFKEPNRRPEIGVRTSKVDGLICLAVKDNGVGFDVEKDGARVFDFYKKLQLDTPGKGKGLYVVKSLLESLGGQIQVESEAHKGTTFYVYLRDFPNQ